MYEPLIRILKESENIVFFGGAGVSTESGIPDFRSAEGRYQAQSQYAFPPEEILSASFLAGHPEIFFQYYFHSITHKNAKPNPAHLALAYLEEIGKLKAVVTQNIDGLHQLAGSRHVLELHGSALRNYCIRCRLAYTLEDTEQKFHEGQAVPRCTCGGVIRPDVVLYGEALDKSICSKAIQAISEADILLVGGTSLVVYPAAGMLRYFGGKSLVLINRDETPFDKEASLVIRDSIGKVFGAVLNYFSAEK